MNTFKISKSSNPVETTAKLDKSKYSIVSSGDNLCMKIEKDYGSEFNVGAKIRFEKYSTGNNGQNLKVCDDDARIIDIVDDDVYRYIYFEYTFIKPLTIGSFQKIRSSDGFNYKFTFTSNHNMVPLGHMNFPVEMVNTDFETYYGVYTLYVRRGGDVINFTDLALCFPNELERGKNTYSGDGYCCPDEDTLFNYETMDRASILSKTSAVTSGERFTPEEGDEVLLCTNPYYFTEKTGNVNLYDNVYVCRYTDYMGLGVVLEQDYDAKRMFQEYQVNELFVKKIKNSIIPDFIDLEKVKYAPAFFETVEDEEVAHLATGLTFNLHFRTRVSASTDDYEKEEIARYKFEDTWHLTDDMTTWNGNGYNGDEFDLKTTDDFYQDEEFLNSSNLIGYLDFTDDDIYNQKNRVKQSFLRLSFYDDINPLTQNLLYYSTIFLDSGDLFGKFVKRKAWLEDNVDDYDETTNPVVWSSAATTDECSAVTSQITVNDEYDTTKSGEGFNLYLFKQDAPIDENDVQDIYMKVEFNHAGNGRTIPLIRWPKEKLTTEGHEDEEDPYGLPEILTIENYNSAIYIKMEIRLTEDGYVYSFPNAVSAVDEDNNGRLNGIVWENDRLVFNLFEPMITPDTFE